MRRVVVPVVVVLLLLASSGSAQAGDGARGSSHADPSSYAWLGPDVPMDTYTVIYVTGLSAGEVVRRLGTLDERLGTISGARVNRYQSQHAKRGGYPLPLVAQVQEHGPGVFAFLPYGLVDDETVAALSSGGKAASFFTDVELDTYVTVARRGEVVRQFDAGFEPPPAGALQAEEGLDWGARRQNTFATAWAFLERLTRIHVSHRWFDEPHPAFAYQEQSF